MHANDVKLLIKTRHWNKASHYGFKKSNIELKYITSNNLNIEYCQETAPSGFISRFPSIVDVYYMAPREHVNIIALWNLIIIA